MIPRILTVGHACLDILHSVESLPVRNAKVNSSSMTIQVGGNAANAAVAIADMGCKADLLTVFGSSSHPFTRILTLLIRERNVGIGSCDFDDTQPCSTSTIMVTPDGERTIVNWQGESIMSSIARYPNLDSFDLIMGDTYRLPMVRETFARAKDRLIPTMIDIDKPVALLDDIPRADHVWFSYDCWKAHRAPLVDLQSIFQGVVGITDGERPIVWMGKDKVIRYHAPPFVKPINTLGAGDVFRARLAIGICLGQRMEEAVSAASISASDHVGNIPLSPMFGHKLTF